MLRLIVIGLRCNKMTKIIGICGFQGSGKDTIAYHLEKQGYVRLSFASILKDILSILFSWDREMLEGLTKEARQKREIVDAWWSEKLKIPNFTPRYALQYIGTEVMRNHFHQDIWVLAVERKLRTLHRVEAELSTEREPTEAEFSADSVKGVVISDLRYSNEIAMLNSMGAKLIYVMREKPSWFDEAKEGNYDVIPKTLHQSEWDWITCIRNTPIQCITNNKTIEALYEEIDNELLS